MKSSKRQRDSRLRETAWPQARMHGPSAKKYVQLGWRQELRVVVRDHPVSAVDHAG
ncbi:hypothetical protein ACNKHL_15910 [Shigella flexneri]